MHLRKCVKIKHKAPAAWSELLWQPHGLEYAASWSQSPCKSRENLHPAGCPHPISEVSLSFP